MHDPINTLQSLPSALLGQLCMVAGVTARSVSSGTHVLFFHEAAAL
jgi:hypothetical protein